MNLDWKAIRPLNGSKFEGFEELCAQLARVESPADAKFKRKGTPDAGVECYCVLPDETEWGWQAKYFHSLGTSQWSQLDHSVKTALDKHPALVRYFVCVPMNRSEPRTPGRQFAMDRWSEHEEKWKDWATARGMNVEFVWWGSSELLDELADPKHIGRVHFWFDKRGFDHEWFQDRLKEAVDAAGPRYTPQVHVDLPVARDLELFGHSENEADRVKSLARDVRREFQYARMSSGDDEVPGLRCALDELLELWETILSRFADLEFAPDRVNQLEGLSEVLDSAVCRVDEVRALLRRSEADSQASESAAGSAHSQSPLRNLSEGIAQLRHTLLRVHSEIAEADRIANSSLMILKGDAGTGKTHLLCDVASARVESGAPTVLLMGQRFNEGSDPWTQVLQQLGMQDSNTEEFVGALEAAAQSANRRALVIVDALNEGGGRSIWPVHLAAFLARIEQSPWIATLLSVRSTYAEAVIPGDVRIRAEEVVHQGFSGREYDAVQTFFSHYGIELPSVPILRPEFSNPLFLKMVCVGLSERGEMRLPRGFHGITMTFNFYLDAVNGRLAKALDYNPNDRLVHQALDRLAEFQVVKNERWPPREEAEAIVNALLPREGFSNSLYRALVGEGVLMEDMRWSPIGVHDEVALSSNQDFTKRAIAMVRGAGEVLVTAGKKLISRTKAGVTAKALTLRQRTGSVVDQDLAATGLPSQCAGLEEVVSISYDRFADHLIAKRLLSSHLDEYNPDRAFGERGKLAFLWQERSYNHVGLIEAMCVQVPELTSMELVTLAPGIRNTPYFAGSFMQSIVWRRLDALTKDTRRVFDQIVEDHGVSPYVLNTLLTVSTIPHHQFNAEFLDCALRLCSMPDRDAWWSTYLHDAYGKGGAVDRLLDWAQGQSKSNSVNIEPQVIDLAAVTLAWMLTTSNRFLRDRATKALVQLLTERLQSATALVARFADVDDPYVTERLYAVAYGVAMRSHDPAGVGDLASTVYGKVFASGMPPVHIFLRDYARGVVERAVHLGSDIDVDIKAVRPPYKSAWPIVPEEHAIQSLTSGWDRGAWQSGDLEWSRNRIRRSVMNDDFALYIIGTNWGGSDWLSLRLSDNPWRSPDQRTAVWLQKLSAPERAAWEDLKRIKAEQPIIIDFDFGDDQPMVLFKGERSTLIDQREIECARRELETAHQRMMETITEDHLYELESIDQARVEGPPHFDLGTIQRYVLWRVFDLGWTIDLFGHFDRFNIGHSGREPGKPERIGKKYQWIAYHEILAYISDQYQYLDRYGEVGGNRLFAGTWQESLRNIDPSSTLSSIPGGTSWRGHAAAWWGSSSYTDWHEELSHQDWISRRDDIPNIPDQLIVTSSDGIRWVNVCGRASWQQAHSADVEPTEVDKRDIWLHFTGYFVRAEDADELMEWARDVDFWGRWMPEPPSVYGMFLGEYGWAPAFRYFDRQFYSDYYGGEWIKPSNKAPAYVQPASFEYRVESGGYDCSVTDGYALQLPHYRLLNSLQLRWSGQAGDYLDSEGKLAALDPTAHEDGPSALLVREDVLLKYLCKEGLVLWWTILGEKWVVGSLADHKYHGSLKISGAYRYTDQGPEGFLNYRHEQRPIEPDT